MGRQHFKNLLQYVISSRRQGFDFDFFDLFIQYLSMEFTI